MQASASETAAAQYEIQQEMQRMATRDYLVDLPPSLPVESRTRISESAGAPVHGVHIRGVLLPRGTSLMDTSSHVQSALALSTAPDVESNLRLAARAGEPSSGGSAESKQDGGMNEWKRRVDALRGLLEEARLAERHAALLGRFGTSAWERASRESASLTRAVKSSVD